MKRITLWFILIISVSAYSQDLKFTENKTDDFTKKVVRTTNFVKFHSGSDFYAYFGAGRYDSTYYFSLKIMYTNTYFSISSNDQIMLKLQNDSVITVNAQGYTVSCAGCGAVSLWGADAPGAMVAYILEDDIKEYLKNNTIVKIRVYTSKGYSEAEVDEKFNKNFRRAFEMVETGQ